MSMFKTLQSNPGTISLFKPTPVIYDLLKLHAVKPGHPKAHKSSIWSKIVNGSNEPQEIENYIIQEEVGSPTWDQVKLIKSYADTINNIKVFKQVFPLFVRDDKIEINEDLYQSVQHSDWFKTPLIVDWDKSIIANDLETVRELLKTYD